MRKFATGLLCVVAASGFLAAGAEAGRNPMASLIVHTGTYSAKTTTCTNLRSAVTNCQTANPTVGAPPPANAFVALYANQLAAHDPDPGASGSPGLHLKGIDFGVNYNASLYVVTWTKCGDLELPTDGVNPEGNPYPAWPLPGSGNSVIWGTTQRGELCLVGFFRVTTYGYSGTLTIADHPDPAVQIRLLDDHSNFDEVSSVGFAGIGGAMGMNNCPVRTQNKTWGSIKALYRR